jgi:hypothetical protein
MFTILYVLVYFAFLLISKKEDVPFLDRVLLFVIALDFYLGFQIIVFSNVHEKYGANGPPLILKDYDPILGVEVNRTTYPLAVRGEYYQAILTLSQIQHIVLQYIFAILMVLTIIYSTYIATKKFVNSDKEI